MDSAKNIYIGRGFVNNFEPSTTDVSLFPCAAALSMSAFGPGCCWYMKALLAVFGFLLMLSMYLLAYEATGKRNVALMASVLLAVLPITVLNAIQLLTDIPFLAFMMICFTFYLKSQKTGKPSDMIACGVFAGVATLTRLTGLIIFGVIFGVFLYNKYWPKWLWPKLGESKSSGLFKTCVLTILPGAAVVSVWYLCDFSYYGFVSGFVPGSSPMSSVVSSMMKGIIDFSSVGKMLGSAFVYIGPFLLAASVYVVYLILMRKRDFKLPSADVFIIWLIVLIAYSSIVPGFTSRYILIFVPPVVILAAKWFLENWKAKRRIVLSLLALHLIFSFLGVAAYFYLYPSNNPLQSNTMVFYDAGRWIKANSAGIDTLYEIGSGGPLTMGYYADKRTESLGDPATPEKMEEIRGLKPGMLLITNIFNRKFNETALIEITGLVLCKDFSDGRFFARIYKNEC
jgi:4-amino-4-deoxy-L-arabinose transferase-like glycosyltransferase